MDKILKRFLLLFVVLFLCSNSVFAVGAGYRYSDAGAIYSNTTVPISLPNARYIKSKEQKKQGNIIPVSNKAKNNEIDIKTLKSSKSSSINIFWLVEVGDAGIQEAARKGNIKTVHYVDYTYEKVYVPMIFLPIYFKRGITTVYGE